ncbi:hypothetical protein MHLP_02645 [Candidatus Mycoplasma haematolamae str. Purdue]|uniref:Uncharacterized protein n=1 Tax=Mycoplasma haematolamae (strain Purdue) TaxID=1212765 RepID=I7CJR9_MYCHA|nr:hypothetical protein [Candidatus Mycoplasma haematolamae]AFO52109.1 hypothetical protein MHLP_02645 [Candidatus Mycoplasma haematolamae str. Purdue]
MFLTASAKFAGSALAVTGVAGASYAVLGPSFNRESNVTTFEILGDQYIPKLEIACTNKPDRLTVLDLSLRNEDFQFKCDYKAISEKEAYISKELKVDGARQASEKAPRDNLTCTPEASENTKYQCVYTASNGAKDKELQESDPSMQDKDPTAKFLRPKD